MNVYMTRAQARRYNRLCNQAVQARREERRAEQDLLAVAEEHDALQSKVNKRALCYGYARIRHEQIKTQIKHLLSEVKEKNAETAERRKGKTQDEFVEDLTHRELGMLLRRRPLLPGSSPTGFSSLFMEDAYVVRAEREMEHRRREKRAHLPKPECSREEEVAMAIVNSTHPFWAHNAPRVYAGWAFREACASLHLPVSDMNIREVAIALFRGEIDLPLSRVECHKAYCDKFNQPRSGVTSLEVDCLVYHTTVTKRRLLAARGELR